MKKVHASKGRQVARPLDSKLLKRLIELQKLSVRLIKIAFDLKLLRVAG
jgi:hypothetical protein